jgi:hypothetical protein
MFQSILYALCILYGTYGIVFCSKLCFVIYKEERERRLKIRREYEIIGRLHMPNIRTSDLRDYNSELETIIEEDVIGV